MLSGKTSVHSLLLVAVCLASAGRYLFTAVDAVPVAQNDAYAPPHNQPQQYQSTFGSGPAAGNTSTPPGDKQAPPAYGPPPADDGKSNPHSAKDIIDKIVPEPLRGFADAVTKNVGDIIKDIGKKSPDQSGKPAPEQSDKPAPEQSGKPAPGGPQAPGAAQPNDPNSSEVCKGLFEVIKGVLLTAIPEPLRNITNVVVTDAEKIFEEKFGHKPAGSKASLLSDGQHAPGAAPAGGPGLAYDQKKLDSIKDALLSVLPKDLHDTVNNIVSNAEKIYKEKILHKPADDKPSPAHGKPSPAYGDEPSPAGDEPSPADDEEPSPADDNKPSPAPAKPVSPAPAKPVGPASPKTTGPLFGEQPKAMYDGGDHHQY